MRSLVPCLALLLALLLVGPAIASVPDTPAPDQGIAIVIVTDLSLTDIAHSAWPSCAYAYAIPERCPSRAEHDWTSDTLDLRPMIVNEREDRDTFSPARLL